MPQLVVGSISSLRPGAKITPAGDPFKLAKKIFFPLPQFADLKLVWKHYLAGRGASLPADFRLDSLAEAS